MPTMAMRTTGSFARFLTTVEFVGIGLSCDLRASAGRGVSETVLQLTQGLLGDRTSA